MNYEYGTGQQGLNYPNPYKTENIFLIIRTFIFTIGFLFFIIYAKLDLNQSNWLGLSINLLASMAFLSSIINNGYKLSKQLRVYFGRGQPSGLAPEVNPDIFGTSPKAGELKETIRQGALTIEPPPGNVNGILYSYFKNLIIAPYEIQALMQHVFSNLIKTVVLFSIFLLSSFFAFGFPTNGWLGAYFFVVTFYLIVQPITQKRTEVIALSLKNFWGLFFISIAIPVAIFIFGKQLPNIANWNLGLQSFFILMIMLIGEIWSLIALKANLYSPTGITSSFEQDAVSFNAPPSLINQEIERKLQNEWVSAIPNRIYSRLAPGILKEQSGQFSGQVIQETQPMIPQALREGQDIHFVSNDERLKPTYYLDILALIFTILGTIGSISLITFFHHNPIHNFHYLYWLPLFTCLLFLTAYWMKIGHQLWGRFDFESKLYIIEYEGTYTTAKMNFGNALKDTLQSQKNIINVESMTLRVWVTHLNTVVFGHGIHSATRPRYIISLIGLKDESTAFLNHLKSFIQNQSMILGTNSQEDLKRVNNLSQLNVIGNQANPSPLLGNTQAQIIAALEQNKKNNP
jgi:hypothetical protein